MRVRGVLLALEEVPDDPPALGALPEAPLVRVRGALGGLPVDATEGEAPALDDEAEPEVCGAPLDRVVTGALPDDVGEGAGADPGAAWDPLVRVRGVAVAAATDVAADPLA